MTTKEDTISTNETQASLLEAWKKEFQEKYPKGYVLYEGEINRYDDSWFYEWLWLDDKQEVVQVDVGGTNFWYPSHSSHLPKMWDAAPEVIARFKAFAVAKAVETERKYQLGCATKFTETVQRGSKVAVSKNRNLKGEFLAAGAEGTVFWVGKDKFSGGERLGVELEDGRKVFINGSWVVLIHTWRVSDEKIDQYMQEFAEDIGQAEWQALRGWVIGRSNSCEAWRGERFCEPIA